MSVSLHPKLNQLYGLTESQRLDARERARRNVVRRAGDRPDRARYDGSSAGRYPAWLQRGVAVLLLVTFIAAAAPSLFRLFTAGRDAFLLGIADSTQAAIVGLSTFLLAETLVIVSVLAARVYTAGRARWLFAVPVVLGLAVALVGNWTVVKPDSVWSFLEAIVPPVSVLFIALAGERLILDAIERRHADELAYQQALAEYEALAADPEASPRWQATYANALRSELARQNGKGRGKTDRESVLQELTPDDWRALVMREMSADDWYTSAPAAPILPPAPSNGNGNHHEDFTAAPVLTMSGNGTGATSS